MNQLCSQSHFWVEWWGKGILGTKNTFLWQLLIRYIAYRKIIAVENGLVRFLWGSKEHISRGSCPSLPSPWLCTCGEQQQRLEYLLIWFCLLTADVLLCLCVAQWLRQHRNAVPGRLPELTFNGLSAAVCTSSAV